MGKVLPLKECPFWVNSILPQRTRLTPSESGGNVLLMTTITHTITIRSTDALEALRKEQWQYGLSLAALRLNHTPWEELQIRRLIAAVPVPRTREERAELITEAVAIVTGRTPAEFDSNEEFGL